MAPSRDPLPRPCAGPALPGTRYQVVHRPYAFQVRHPQATVRWDESGCYADLGTYSSLIEARVVAAVASSRASNAHGACGYTSARNATAARDKPAIKIREVAVSAHERARPSAQKAPGREMPRVRLPGLPDRRAGGVQNPSRVKHHRAGDDYRVLERDPHFAQTKVPLWVKRGYAPFRRPDEEPYRQEMGYVRPGHYLYGPGWRDVVRVVVEQEDEVGGG